MPRANAKIKSVRCYSLDHKFIAEFSSLMEVVNLYSIPYASLRDCCNRRRGSCRNLIWRFTDNDEFSQLPENAMAIVKWRQSHNV